MLYSSFLQVRMEKNSIHPGLWTAGFESNNMLVWCYAHTVAKSLKLSRQCNKILKRCNFGKSYGFCLKEKNQCFFEKKKNFKQTKSLPNWNFFLILLLEIFWTSTTAEPPVKAQMFSFRPYLSKRIYLSCFVIKDDHTSNAVTQTECNQQHQLCRKIHTLCFKFC